MTVTTNKGWSSEGLATLGDDPKLWTASEAAAILGPPTLTPTQVRALIRCAGLQPAGKRRTTDPRVPGGRHSRVYKAEDLIRLFEALYDVTEPKPAA